MNNVKRILLLIITKIIEKIVNKLLHLKEGEYKLFFYNITHGLKSIICMRCNGSMLIQTPVSSNSLIQFLELV